jgi:hypothetical protein
MLAAEFAHECVALDLSNISALWRNKDEIKTRITDHAFHLRGIGVRAGSDEAYGLCFVATLIKRCKSEKTYHKMGFSGVPTHSS